MTIWFYSDPHFGQDFSKWEGPNGIDKARPFKTVEEMDETLIERHNALVKPGDHVYCLGDFAMKKEAAERVAPRLNGQKRLILGNHDVFGTEFYRALGFKKIMAYRIWEGDNLIMSHIPLAPWSVKVANVHGHCHLSKPMFYEMPNPDARGFVRTVPYVNISAEHTNYQPVSLEQIRSWIK